MIKIKLFLYLALVLPLFGAPGVVLAETGWCYDNYKENPRSPFGLIASFSLELSARKNAGQISEQDFNWAYGEIGKANEAFARNEPKAGCLVLEELEMEFQLQPRPVPLDNPE